MENINEVMAGRANKQLEDLIIKRSRYAAESVEAAIAELEKRGRIFTFAELRSIDLDLRQKKREINEKQAEAWYPVPEVIADDSVEPSYFSQGAVHLFSIVFSTLFGVILMAVNFYKAGNKRALLEVIIFGILYNISTILLLPYIPNQQYIVLGYNVLINVIGALILTQIFWRKYIGNDTEFKPRPIGKLMLVSLFVSVVLVYFLFTHGMATHPGGLVK